MIDISWFSEKEFIFSRQELPCQPGTSWSNQELPCLTSNKAGTSWFTQEDMSYSKPVTKPRTRKVKNLKTRNQNREPHSWLVPGSCQEVWVLVYL
jgi:hypothetical protein